MLLQGSGVQAGVKSTMPQKVRRENNITCTDYIQTLPAFYVKGKILSDLDGQWGKGDPGPSPKPESSRGAAHQLLMQNQQLYCLHPFLGRITGPIRCQILLGGWVRKEVLSTGSSTESVAGESGILVPAFVPS